MDNVEIKSKYVNKGARRADASLFSVLEEEYKRRNINERKIFSDWPVIVGRDLAEATAPLRIKFRGRNDAALYVALYRPALATALQMRQTEILENLARYLGHRYVGRMVVRHHYAAPKEAKRILPQRERDDRLWRKYEARFAKDSIADERLRDQLDAFARAFCGVE